MEKERPHEEDVSTIGYTEGLLPLAAESSHVVVVEPAEAVRTRENPQGSIVGTTGIEVQAQRDHPLEHRDGGLDVVHARLHRPGAEAGHLGVTVDGDGEILVPGDLPTGAGGLGEEEGSDNASAQSDDVFGEFRDQGSLQSTRDLWAGAEHLARTENSSAALLGMGGLVEWIESVVDFVERRGVDCTSEPREA